MNSKEIFLAACRCASTPRRPVWLMRQVGRYLPGYKRLREKHSFKELLAEAELAAEATVSVLEACDPDALIIFSDILTVPAALGAEVAYEPALSVRSPGLDKLASSPDEKRLAPTYEALRAVSKQYGEEKAIIGFAGAPFTLLAYLVGDGPDLKAFLLREETPAKKSLSKLAQAVAAHLRSQWEAGASVLHLFDTKAGELPPGLYREFALDPLREVLFLLEDVTCPKILFGRGTNHVLHAEALEGVILSVDWTIPFDRIPQAEKRAVQGNLDPAVLLAGPDVTRDLTQEMLKQGDVLGGHIVNLGHGVLPQTPVESVQEFVATAKLYGIA